MAGDRRDGYSETVEMLSPEEFDAFDRSRERWNPERMEAVARILHDRKGFDLRAKQVLEYGCGTGAATRALARLGARAHGVDIYGRLIDIARHRAAEMRDVSFTCIDGDLPLEDHSFDLVVSLEVLEHIPVAKRAGFFKEIHRVLRASGFAYLSYPNFWFPWEQHYHRPFHHWLHRVWPRATLVYEDIPSKFAVRRQLRELFTICDVTQDFLSSDYARRRFGRAARFAARLLAYTPMSAQDYLILEPKR